MVESLKSLGYSVFCVALLGALGPSGTHAEEPHVRWLLSSASDPYAAAAAVSPSGDLLVFGSASKPHGLLQISSAGVVVRTNDLGGASIDAAAFDLNGSLFLAGNAGTSNALINSQPPGDFLAKQDPHGETLWVRKLGADPAKNTATAALAVDAAGNICVAGSIRSPESWESGYAGDRDGLFLRKYAPNGDLLWSRFMEHQNWGRWYGAIVRGLSVDPTGHIVMCGFLSPGSTDFGTETVYPDSTGHSYDGDWFLARFNPDGKLAWVQLGYARSATTDRNGNIYALFGWGRDGVEGLVKLAPAGTLLWSREFAQASVAWLEGIATDDQDEPVFAGQFTAPVTLGNVTLRPRSAVWEDFLIAKTDAQGAVQWAMSGGGSESDRAHAVLPGKDGNIYLTGVIRNRGTFGGYPLVPAGPNENYFVALLNPSPALTVARAAGQLTLSWPAKATNYVLESASALPSGPWEAVPGAEITTEGARLNYSARGNGKARFFRLTRKP
jgi:hypothetical protein